MTHSAASPRHAQYPFIDALRGYAVLMVIICHTGGMFPELPYPLKKLTNFGWHGVQLFFLMSCVTLMLSWLSDEAKGRARVIPFWTRRLFRIAPLYYLAGAFYFWIEPPASDFNMTQLLASLSFINAWHPLLIPTVPDRWMVVPGGWSISVEFTFYMVFPLIAIHVRSMRAAVIFCAATIIIGSVVDPMARTLLIGLYGETATGNFLYFWFPNQAPVFALGTVLFHALRRTWGAPDGDAARFLRGHANAILVTCLGALAAAANISLPQTLSFSQLFFVPALLIASLILMTAALALANAPTSVFNNRLIRSLGKVSFSAYLVHFAVLHKLPLLLPTVFDVRHVAGWYAIVIFAALWPVALAITFGLSHLTYWAIEEPMIALGRRLARRAPPVQGVVPHSA